MNFPSVLESVVSDRDDITCNMIDGNPLMLNIVNHAVINSGSKQNRVTFMCRFNTIKGTAYLYENDRRFSGDEWDTIVASAYKEFQSNLVLAYNQWKRGLDTQLVFTDDSGNLLPDVDEGVDEEDTQAFVSVWSIIADYQKAIWIIERTYKCFYARNAYGLTKQGVPMRGEKRTNLFFVYVPKGVNPNEDETVLADNWRDTVGLKAS